MAFDWPKSADWYNKEMSSSHLIELLIVVKKLTRIF